MVTRLPDKSRLPSPQSAFSLSVVVVGASDSAILRELLEREGFLLPRIAEDMQRYPLKYDALRRHLARDDEREVAL
jgi:hypothetical protein